MNCLWLLSYRTSDILSVPSSHCSTMGTRLTPLSVPVLLGWTCHLHPSSCPSLCPCALGMAQTKPGRAENQRVKLKYEVPGRAFLALPTVLSCPGSSDAKGSHSPGTRPCSRREKKTKQNRPGSKYYLNIEERDVSSYGSRISAF